jgi:hypothetical protein
MSLAAWPGFHDVPVYRRLLAPSWPDPLTVCGWLALSLAVLGSPPDAAAGLLAAAASALVFGLIGTAWRGRAEIWASLAAVTLALEHVLRIGSVPFSDQPPRYALIGLLLSLFAIALRRQGPRVLEVWSAPLYFWGIGVAIAAAVAAVFTTLLALLLGVGTLQPLAATAALSGLTLVTHGFELRRRLLGYVGVALILIGYMLQLIWLEVGQPQAFVIPAGLYLMVVAVLEWRRGTGSRFKAVVESGGLTILLGGSLVLAMGYADAGVDRFVWDTLLLVEGVAVLALGASLHWRRSFFCGGLAMFVAVLILLADPLRGLNTWYLVAIIGLLMISAVVFLEQRRQRIPFWLNTWRQRLEVWD